MLPRLHRSLPPLQRVSHAPNPRALMKDLRSYRVHGGKLGRCGVTFNRRLLVATQEQFGRYPGQTGPK